MTLVKGASPIRVLGIDTSLRSTGVGVVERSGSRMVPLGYGTLKAGRTAPHSECLLKISRGVTEYIERYSPQSVSIEGIFYCRNVRTAVTLGQARGAAITACAAAGIPVFEYPPRRVKLAVCGSGAAQKEQVGRMIMKMLSVEDLLPDDESDALALAICHLNSLTVVQELATKPL